MSIPFKLLCSGLSVRNPVTRIVCFSEYQNVWRFIRTRPTLDMQQQGANSPASNFSNILSNLVQKTLLQFSGRQANGSRRLSINCAQLCNQSGGDDPKNTKSTLHLMDFPQIVWPSFIYTIKNWILARIVMQPYLDREFSLDSFSTGSKQAVLYLSSLLSQGKFEPMEGLVTEDALAEIKRNHTLLNVQQRQLLDIKESDLYLSFPYQVGIMLEDKGEIQKRVVEITMCFHCLLGSEEIKRSDPSASELYKYRDRIVVCNSRFIKEFTKGSESDWTINILNYFQPYNTQQ